MPKSYFQSRFSMSKIIRIFLVIIFVIIAIMASIWNDFIKLRWHDEKLTSSPDLEEIEPWITASGPLGFSEIPTVLQSNGTEDDNHYCSLWTPKATGIWEQNQTAMLPPPVVLYRMNHRIWTGINWFF